MNRWLSRRVTALVIALLPFAAAGCGGSAGTDDAGTEVRGSGGANGSGGTTGTGGGSGGTTGGTGGIGGRTAGTGGVAATGGVKGTGGVSSGSGGGAGGAAAGADGAVGGRGGAGAGGLSGAAGSGGTAGQSGSGVVAAGVRWVGRVDLTDTQHPRFSWSGTGFVARFSGTGLSIQITSSGAATMLFKPVVDGTPGKVISIATGAQTASIASGLAAGMHTVELYRQTEGAQGDSQLMGVTVTGGALASPPPAPGRLIEVVGDSISCGYGTLGSLSDTDCYPTESHWDTYEAVAARTLAADVSTIAISGQGAYRNYGGDMTNTAPMVYTRALANDASPAWDFRTQPQAVIVNLGTNDISNSKGDPGAAFETAYSSLLAAIRSKNPGALIVCINGPLLSGTDLSTIQGHIRNCVAARMAAGDQNIEAFEKIVSQTSDKAACQYHPNPAENQIMAGQIVTELRARLGW